MKPENYPEIVYKYRNWTNEFNKNVLLKNQLYLSSPKDFNDPFDCRISDNYYLLDNPDKINEYVNGVVTRQRNAILQRGLNIESERQRLINKISDIANTQQEQETIHFDQQDIRLGILSLSEQWDNILMWSHYAEFHRGYCIGLYEEKLRESQFFGSGGQVFYQKKFPELNPLDRDIHRKSFIESHSKAEDWAYEKEYRLIKLFYPNLPSASERIITIPDNFIAEVIIGLCTPEDHKQEIIDICKKRGIKIFTTYKKPFEFKIERTEI
jgi:hypothetical protein